ncbi:MAG: hypothetical protein HY353_04235 [Candidatus Omnitrophica bacterium]|nr:hypothetical protein [Candidatus Omnitrophota bacterium]
MVELLIAATMMSVLFIGLGGHLRGGITVWRQTTQRVDALQRQRVALDRLERDLANGIVYDSRDDAYDVAEEGKPPPPEFTSTSLAWYTVSPAVKPPSVRFVTYACESSDGTTGLWRTSQSVGEARTHSEPVSELLLPDCKALSVRYAYAPADESAPLEWREEWLFAKELPRLIEVTVRRTAAEQTTRVMAIPHGSFKRVPEPS